MPRAVETRTCVDAEPFALQVTDDSMEPEFRRGCVVVIDPTGAVRDGAYVLAELAGELIFRKLRFEQKRVWLDALNGAYPSRELDDGITAVKGVVVQRAGARRREHKRYD
jgi:SOS-response transcriptional repressor LexA